MNNKQLYLVRRPGARNLAPVRTRYRTLLGSFQQTGPHPVHDVASRHPAELPPDSLHCITILSNHLFSNAVITVPAYFNAARRQATKDAGQILGRETPLRTPQKL